MKLIRKIREDFENTKHLQTEENKAARQKLHFMFSVESILVRTASAWFLAFLLSRFLGNTKLADLEQTVKLSTPMFLAEMILLFLILSVIGMLPYINEGIFPALSRQNKNLVDYAILVISAVIFSAIVLYKEKNVYLAVLLSLLCTILIWHVSKLFHDLVKNRKMKWPAGLFLLFLMTAGMALSIGSLLVLRYYLYRTACFDFGIFAQMYYNMKKSFSPVTTCERNRLLSHFHVHMSPVYYIFLPVYWLFPHPVTLIVMQYAFLLSGLIPLVLLCRKKNLGWFLTVCMGAVYLTLPCLISGLFYDFHENKFLTTFLLWMIYFIESGKLAPATVFMLLVLSVKEDAAIYPAVFGLYLIFGKKEKKNRIYGAAMMFLPVVYFFGIYHFLSTDGEGAMIGRYGNFVPSGGGVADLVINVLKNPAYFFKQLLDETKLQTFLWMFAPVCFIPFLRKKPAEYILLIPALVLTFMTKNKYQMTIDYQYTYGSAAFLIYLCVLFFADPEIKIERRRRIALMCAASSFLIMLSVTAYKRGYHQEYEKKEEIFARVEEELEKIPEDMSVLATTFYLPHLTEREVLYKWPLSEADSDLTFDYIVYDLRYNSEKENYIEDSEKWIEKGYEKVSEITGYLLILKKTDN